MLAHELRLALYSKLVDELGKADLDSSVKKLFINDYLSSIESNEDYKAKLNDYSNNLKLMNELDWLNTPEGVKYTSPIQGKIVLIDFWTYCCINCMHVIPLLRKIEQQFPELLVIGVHSAKFTNEKSKKNIKNAAQRHLIKHAIVCDNDSQLWSHLEINCWPTFMVLNPNGQIIAEFQGELQASYVSEFLSNCFDFYKDKLTEAETIVNKTTSPNTEIVESNEKFSFPSKLCLNSDGTQLFISDSGNNQIKIFNIKNENFEEIGSGTEGFQDGSFHEAKFNFPQGLAYDHEENCLYVADMGNNLIRKVNFVQKIVQTLCGKFTENHNGTYDFIGGKNGKEQEISSPWDVCLINRAENEKFLLIACAGSHQLWLYTFEKNPNSKLNWWKNVIVDCGSLICVVGNGKERNKNNSYPLQASLAQPSAICVDKAMKNVYIADAESSTIRQVSLIDGAVKNVVGGDNLQPDNLFAYGDVDGKGTQARLQHPLDCRMFYEADNESGTIRESLLVADAYNNKIKLIDLKTKFCKCFIDGSQAIFDEPNGLCVDEANEIIYIADTNNHTIKYFNCKTGELAEVKFKNNVQGFRVETFEGLDLNDCGSDFCVCLNVKLNARANNSWSATILTTKGEKKFEGKLSAVEDAHSYRLFQIDKDDVREISLKMSLVYCTSTENGADVCKMSQVKKSITGEDLKKYCCDNQNKINYIIDLN